MTRFATTHGVSSPVLDKSTRGRAVAEPARFELDGGAVLLLEESHAVPLVSMTVALRSGSAHDPPGKEGALRLATRMLRRGCEGSTAKEIESAIDRLGGELGTDVSNASVAVHAQVIERNLDPFMDLVARLLGKPTFADDELGRLKRETAAEIVESRDNDRAVAQYYFRRAFFRGHPYGRGATGTTKTVGALTHADARAAYAKHFVRGNAVIGFSGDIDATTAKGLADRLIRALPPGEPVPDPVPPPTQPKGRRLVFVNKPERTQTQILIGTMGTSPHDEDHVALGVANSVFGGSFTSRLMREVRSKRGWSYGAYARLSVDRQRQALSMWTFPAATDAPPCITLEIGLLEALIDKGIAPKELSFIKRYLVRSHAFDIDTASKRLHQALDVEVLGLPRDYYSSYVAKVEAVTLDQANAALRARIVPDDLLVVVVGTAPDILDKVREAIPKLDAHEVVPFDEE